MAVRPSLLALAMLAAAPAGATAFRDLRSYAAAACLTRQDEPLLKAQGDAWGAAVVQRAHGSQQAFVAVAAAVEAELRRHPAAVGRDDATGGDLRLPVMTCGEIADTPGVRLAIARAAARLASAYRH